MTVPMNRTPRLNREFFWECVACRRPFPSPTKPGGESDRGPSEVVGITAGSLDDPNWFRPEVDFLI